MLTRVRMTNFRRHAETDLLLSPEDQIVMITGENGAGKCLPGYVPVYDPLTGESIPIQRFVEERRSSIVGYSDGRVAPVPVTDWLSLGSKPTVRLKFSNGTHLDCAATHPVLTDKGCVRAGDLPTKAWVAQPRHLPAGRFSLLSADEAWLLGLLVGDGSVATDSPTLTNTDPAVAAEARRIVEATFPDVTVRSSGTSHRFVSTASRSERRPSLLLQLRDHLREHGVLAAHHTSEGSAYRFERAAGGPSWETLTAIEDSHGLDLWRWKCALHGSRAVAEWARSFGLRGTSSRTKFVPPELALMPDEQAWSFLGGYWQADGWFSGEAAAGTVSPALADGIHKLLLRVGILATRRQGDPLHRVGVIASHARAFATRIPLVGAKAAARDQFVEALPEGAGRRASGAHDRIPESFTTGYTSRSTTGHYRSAEQLQAHAMGRVLYAEHGGDQDVLDADITWVQLRTIEPLGDQECFDVTVDTSEHLYVADTTIVHNSSLLEGINYGLWGQGRNGARRLDTLVRRGAEIEGMEVEVEFTLGEDRYRVVRRREGKLSTAILFGNDNPLVEGSREVSAAISQILGLDHLGFRLAVVAQQKELDALTRLGAPARAKALARLLRLDAVTRARDEARGMWRAEQAVLDSLPGGDDLTELAAAVATAEADLAAARAAESDCRSAIAELEASLAASAGIDEVYHQRRADLSAASATLAAVEAELARLEREREGLVVPDPVPAPPQTLEEIEAHAREVERAIAQGEAASQLRSQRQMLTNEIERVESRLGEVSRQLHKTGAAAAAMERSDELGATEAALRERIVELSARRDDLRVEYRSAANAADVARERRDAVKLLGGSCDACGQDIPHEHRDDQQRRAEEQLAAAETTRDALRADGEKIAAELGSLEGELADCEQRRTASEAAMREAAALEGEQAELQRRRDTYLGQLDRLPDGDADPSELYAERGRIALAVMAAREAEENDRARTAAQERVAELEIAMADARMRVDAARADQAAAALDADLEEQYRKRADAVEQHRAELEMLGALCAETASSAERLTAARDTVRRGNEMAATRRSHALAGATAANAARLLGDVESTLSVSVRPALEGAVADLLSKMSEGRFSSVRIGKDYTCDVLDDGAYRSIADLSGGEQDLVALALRLGLASVVAERTGGGHVGFLILDEVFGSQDTGRRQAIVTALRALRATYGQIWCISHVGGLEDAADRVIEVALDPSGVAVAE